MSRKEVEVWNTVSLRMYYHHLSMGWKHNDDTCLRVYGVTELNVGTIPADWLGKILAAVRKGYVTTRSEKCPWLNVLRLIVEVNPVRPMKIGYIGRSKCSVFFPPGDDAEGHADALNTMLSIEFGENRRVFRARTDDADFGMREVYGQMAQEDSGKGVAPKDLFQRSRRALAQQLKPSLSWREPLIEWLHRREIVRIPFASHDKQWSYRR